VSRRRPARRSGSRAPSRSGRAAVCARSRGWWSWTVSGSCAGLTWHTGSY